MTRTKPSTTKTAGSLSLENALWFVVAAFTIVIPLFVSPKAADVFRLPKELLVRAEAILIVATIGIGLLWQPGRWRSLLTDRVTAIALGACAAGTLIGFTASTNRLISAQSVIYVLSLSVVFWGAYIGVRSRSARSSVLIGTLAAVANALLALMQQLNIYNPFTFPRGFGHRMQTTAMIGNPNDVGASLTVCFIAALAYALVSRRSLFIAIAALLFAGVIASDALTSIIAVIAGVVVTIVLAFPRRAMPAIVAVGTLAVLMVLLLPPMRSRMNSVVAAVRARDWDAVTAHRYVGYLTAVKIFRDHPLTGAGPGTFKWLHLPYRIRVEADHHELYLKMLDNLGEAHSDQLQLLAEEGLLGYAAMLVAVAALGSRSLRRRADDRELDERTKFVRLAAMPLAIGFLALAATGFPLELAAVMTPLLFFAACIFAWSSNGANV